MPPGNPDLLKAEDLPDSSPPNSPWTKRSANDLNSLLLELARALRGLSYYPETDPQRDPLIDRAFRAVEADLARAGVLDLQLRDGKIEVEGMDEEPLQMDSGMAGEFAAALGRHELHRVRLDRTLNRHALHGLLDLLGHDEDRYDSPQEFARRLSAREASGIELNEFEVISEHIQQKLSSTPPCASASLGAAILVQPSESTQVGTETDSDPADPSTVTDPTTVTMETRPLEYTSPSDRGQRLRARLIELDQTTEDAAYGERAADVVRWAEDLRRSGLQDEWYRAAIVLADHAVGFGGRSESQARAAEACFREIVRGEGINELIDRTSSARPEESIRSAQLLLQLGETAVPPLFDRLCESEEVAPPPALTSLILTLGPAVLPTLAHAIQSEDPSRARIAIHLAGELQNPDLLPVLIEALKKPDLENKLETIRALSLLPGEASKTALEAALDSDLDEIVVAATSALATADGREAVPALLDVLEASVLTTRTTVCIELVKVLGRIGDERAVPRLASILERRPMLRRAHWHAIQLAAVDALNQLPTKEARRSLERIAQNGARPIQERAKMALARPPEHSRANPAD